MTDALGSRLLARLPEAEAALLDDLGGAVARGGARLWLVGGAVRDLWLGEPSSDLDLVVEGPFEPAVAAVIAAGHAVAPKAAAFLTCGLRPRAGPDYAPGLVVDLGAARRESYAHPAALPRVEAGTLDEDLRRRDVSLNAVAVSLAPASRGAIADPTGGLADLAAGRLRVLHADSFEDDPTRAFRVARFAGRYGFELEARTAGWLAAAVAAGRVGALSPARVRAQVALLAAEPLLDAPLAWHERAGLLAALHPALAAPADITARVTAADAAAAGLAALGLPVGDSLARLVLALLVGRPPGAAAPALARLGYDGTPARRRAAEIGALPDLASRAAALGPRALHDALAPLDPAGLPVAVALAAPEGRAALLRFALDVAPRRPRLTGRDLEALGVPRGPAIGQMLDRLLTERLEGRLARPADEEAFVRSALRLH